MTYAPLPGVLCFWCGKANASLGWACAKCYPLKEQGYANARRLGIKDQQGIYEEVLKVIRARNNTA